MIRMEDIVPVPRERHPRMALACNIAAKAFGQDGKSPRL